MKAGSSLKRRSKACRNPPPILTQEESHYDD